jgi:phenylacetate-CoA ligase
MSWLLGQIGANIVYPAAEKYLGRDIRTKYRSVAEHYHKPFAERQQLQLQSLVRTLEWAGSEVPYYQGLFQQLHFEPQKIFKDIRYFSDLPFLTKADILQQGDNLMSRHRKDSRMYRCKTGGSTGGSVIILYDQYAADYSAAVTRFARTLSGKFPHHRELHFASKFIEEPSAQDRRKERFKKLAMNRANIYFNNLSQSELELIWRRILKFRPYMVHAHPSTAYALALAIESTSLPRQGFQVFESSGELLDAKKRRKIEEVFQCRVFDRYGLAEVGVIAYQNQASTTQLRIFDDFCYPETHDGEIVVTALQNPLMPLIRYRTGDLANLETRDDGFYFSHMYGRVHDLLKIGPRTVPTHHIQDVLDRIGGIVEFQIEKQHGEGKYDLKIVSARNDDNARIGSEIDRYFGSDLSVKFVGMEQLTRVGDRQKFRYLVSEAVAAL